MANNIVMKITDYIAHLWHDTDNDIVMAKNINGWENTLQQHAEFLKRFSWQPNTAYPKNSVLLYPFGLHTKLVSKNAGTSGSNEPTWSDASGQEGSRTITDNDIIWEEQPIQVSADTTPIGTIKQQLWNSAPPGYLKMTQSYVLNRSEYPELWDFVQKYYPLTSEVEWQKMLTLNKTSVGYFSAGDGSTNFRTPFILDFGRGGENAGSFFRDQNKLHNHNLATGNKTGTTQLRGTFIAGNQVGCSWGQTTGVFSGTGIWAGECAHKSDTREVIQFIGDHNHDIKIEYTGVNTGGEEAYPKHIIMPYYLRILNI